MSVSERWHTFFEGTAANLVLRTFVLLAGIMFIALGVALSRATGLGTSPISCIPAVVSFASAWTIGEFTMLLNTLFLVAQFLLLRRRFKPVQLLQLPFTLVFSAAIDLFVPLAECIPLPNYPACLALLCGSTFVTALGVFLEVKASLIVLPGEGIVLALATVTHIEFPKCKVAFDTTNVVVGAIISLVSMGGFYGVREGTIIAAVVTGWIVKLYRHLFPNTEQWIPLEGKITLTPKAS